MKTKKRVVWADCDVNTISESEFDGDTITDIIFKFENILSSLPEDQQETAFLDYSYFDASSYYSVKYRREETDEEFKNRLDGLQKVKLRELKELDRLKRKYPESSK